MDLNVIEHLVNSATHQDKENYEPESFFDSPVLSEHEEKDSCVNRDQGSRHPPKHIPVLQRQGGHHTTGATFGSADSLRY